MYIDNYNMFFIVNATYLYRPIHCNANDKPHIAILS